MARTPFDRSARVNSLLRQVLAELLEFEVKDPRTRGLTLTDVEVTGDLREAKVYVCGPPELDRDAALAGLRRAGGFLRREVGNRIRLRATPQLHFFYDDSLEYGARIEARLRDLGLGDAAEDEDAPRPADADDDEADDDGSAGT